ncbi:hypothetical protein NP233_g1584 [Leucocoprinus birnbaumii]|uniref:Uncharacterized protein n=1 Tax=Leucocoprinus birnbaumii TaxID=56174 RepID=A0AAD5W2X6_9AGAR|nr:hypothetical protein NP233_g1584 [Leucocoprinus birnbaumii]
MLQLLKGDPKLAAQDLALEVLNHPREALYRFCDGMRNIEEEKEDMIDTIRRTSGLPNIVRTGAMTPLDELFIRKCGNAIPPLNIDVLTNRYAFRDPTAVMAHEEPQGKIPEPGYLLLGYGDGAVLVILSGYYDKATVAAGPGDGGNDGAITIYTKDMLDDL